MTTNSRIQTNKQNLNTENLAAISTSSKNYNPPSVPISVYRQLAGELQATQAKLTSLKLENQQLVQQNQQLRQEVVKIVKSAQHLEKLVTSFDEPTTSSQIPVPQAAMPNDNHQATNFMPMSVQLSTPLHQPKKATPPTPKVLNQQVIEIEETKYNDSSGLKGSGHISGWLLAIIMVVIMLAFFGIGFFVVRPQLNNNNR